MPDRSLEERARFAYVALPMTLSADELGQRIPEGFRRLDMFLGEHELEDRGPSIIRYRRGSQVGPWDIEVGWIMEPPRDVPAPFIADELPGGVYVVGWHDGPYSRIAETTLATVAWSEAKGIVLDVDPDPDGDRWACWYELYLADPLFGPEGPTGAVEVSLLTRG